MSNAVLERIHQVIGNLVQTCNIIKSYVDEDDPWLGTLAAAKNRIKGYSTGQLIFVRDMILPIKHTMYWELIREKNQTQINKDNIR